MSTKQIKVEATEVTTYCDLCGLETPTRKCEICQKDICRDCGITTDWESLEPGSFFGDYSDRFCKRCWSKGEKIVIDIRKCRNDADKLESSLIEMWKSREETDETEIS